MQQLADEVSGSASSNGGDYDDDDDDDDDEITYENDSKVKL
jgi:hypothetical protein